MVSRISRWCERRRRGRYQCTSGGTGEIGDFLRAVDELVGVRVHIQTIVGFVQQ